MSRISLKRNQLWRRVAAAAGDRIMWGFYTIRRQHIKAQLANPLTPAQLRTMSFSEKLAWLREKEAVAKYKSL